MGIKYLEGFKERCPTASVSEQEPEICSLRVSGNMVCRTVSANTSSTTRKEITSMSLLMAPSREACHTSSTTERPEEFSMLRHAPSVSSLTSVLTPVSYQREFMSVSSMSASVSPEKRLSKDAETMTPKREQLRSQASVSKSRGFHSSNAVPRSSIPRKEALST